MRIRERETERERERAVHICTIIDKVESRERERGDSS